VSPTPNRRQRLASDTRRTVGMMRAVLVDAERAKVEVPEGVVASVTVWRSWTERLEELTEEE
jgi:hypothetical protein